MRKWIELLETIARDLIKSGEFSEDERFSAINGLCGTFALSLYRELKSRNIDSQLVLFAEDEMDSKGNIWWSHVAVRVEGRYYDIRGEINERETHKEFFTRVVIPISEVRLEPTL